MTRRRPSPRPIGALARLCLLAGLSGLAGLWSSTAAAVPPSTGDFQITYWTSNADGTRGRQMTANDLQSYVDKARCECGQAVSARVTIRAQGSEPIDNDRVRVYVGNNCDVGQLGNTLQNRPCALVIDANANAFTGKNVDFEFNPLWLASGISGQSEGQAIETAIAANECGTQEGDGGVWICVENGEQTDCQLEEWVVKGTQTQIVDDDGTAPSLRYDFRAPAVNAENFRATGGDGSILVKWDNESTSDLQGYRVLCADANGNPVDGQGFTLSSVTRENRGTIYYTADNLCPDGPFDQVDVDDIPDEDVPFPTDDEGDTDGGSTGAAELQLDPDVSLGDPSCCMPGVCDDTGCVLSVQQEDPECAANDWGESCADLAGQFCDVCGGAGYCCAANPTEGCSDSTCETEVCAEDEFLECCTVQWTATCANRAKEICDSACPQGTTGDPSGTDTDTTTTTSGDTDTDSGTDTDTDAGTSGGPISSPIQNLDWAYVCSDYIGFSANSAKVTGLDNDVEYQVMVVAFDRAGNPIAASEVLTAVPRETTDLWEQCEAQGEVCGNGGFCSCTHDDSPARNGVWMVLTVLGGLLARRRRTADTAGEMKA